MYSYVRNSPINAIDPTGEVTVFVHGTWSSPNTFSSDYRKQVISDLGDTSGKSFNFKWSGKNNKTDRSVAANNLNSYLVNYDLKENEQVNIVAHSHGGNVAIEAINNIKFTQEGLNPKLILLGTPNRNDYQLNNKNKNLSIYNIYSEDDGVQTKGGPAINGGRTNGRVRSDGNGWNIKYNYSKDPGPLDAHSNLHSKSVWDKIKKYIKKDGKSK